MTLWVRDEADILAANLDFHLSYGIDAVIVTDNASIDGTSDLLREYERAGAVRLLYAAARDHNQHRWVTRMARLAALEMEADWLIHSDADEFWIPAAKSYGAALSNVDPGADVVVARRFNMVPCRAGGGPRELVARDLSRLNLAGRELLSKIAHRSHPEACVEQGNHEVSWPGRGHAIDDGRLEILHFPIRDRARFERSIINTGQAYRRNTELPLEVGAARRWLYERWEVGHFDRMWDELVPDDTEIERRLAAGIYDFDRRVARRLRAIERRRWPWSWR